MKWLPQVQSPKDLRALPESALPELCAELRTRMVEVCGQVGGHLGASLGAVELVVALHRVFRSPVDRLVFDVGHQAYAHKLLTGRQARFGSLRQSGGMSPFVDPSESEHDAFVSGHACTAVSVGLGILQAKLLQGQPGQVVAVVGDGGLTGGLTFEGLNQAAALPLPLKIVLNDNGMSISQNVGAVAKMSVAERRQFFESLGVVFIGPVDGHDLAALTQSLALLKETSKAAILQVHTHKGRGFPPAERDAATKGHAMGPFDAGASGRKETYSEAWAQVLRSWMARDSKAMVLTPAMLEGSALAGLQQEFPQRVVDVGIAEQQCVAQAAGLAHAGMRPVVCIYSTFLQRALDQVIHDVVLPQEPVLFAVDRAGLVGGDGATHQGLFDVAMLSALPGLSLAAPIWKEDLDAVLKAWLQASRPMALRFPRGPVPAGSAPAPFPAVGKSRWLVQNSAARGTFVALGPVGIAAMEAARSLEWNVLDIAWMGPFEDEAMVSAFSSGAVVVAEEASCRGGLAGQVAQWMAERGCRARFAALGVDRFVRHGNAEAQRAALGLDAAGLIRAARGLE